MKFYSEKLDLMFDSMEELLDAETPKKKKTKKVTKENTVEEPVATEPAVPSRKELAAAVEAADNGVKEAYANYNAAKSKVEELSKMYLKEVNDILDPAKKAVKEAETARFEAIKAFNDSFGAYQVSYTGAKAAEEWAKSIDNINARANKILRDLFW